MRSLVWAFGLSLLACGRVDASPTATASTHEGGSNPAKGGAANAAAPSGAGIGGLHGGVSGGAGGVATPTDTATSAGKGAVGGEGGNGAVSGAAGNGAVSGAAGATAGVAGAPAIDGTNTYDACACGCCGAPVSNSCYYPELGEELSEIIARDRAKAASGDCPESCVSGTHYARCETADEESAAYKLAGFADNVQHMVISRESQTGRCTQVKLQVRIPHPGVVLELPKPSQGLESASDGACAGADPSPVPTLGALGLVTQPDDSGCVFDFDFTLFLLADDGTADAVRFRAEGVRIAGCTG